MILPKEAALWPRREKELASGGQQYETVLGADQEAHFVRHVENLELLRKIVQNLEIWQKERHFQCQLRALSTRPTQE